MQKVMVAMESVVIVLLLSMLVWQRYQRTLKRWWKT
jgi:hypothetical protein